MFFQKAEALSYRWSTDGIRGPSTNNYQLVILACFGPTNFAVYQKNLEMCGAGRSRWGTRL